jgi:hypothetical protein
MLSESSGLCGTSAYVLCKQQPLQKRRYCSCDGRFRPEPRIGALPGARLRSKEATNVFYRRLEREAQTLATVWKLVRICDELHTAVADAILLSLTN